jgi:tripartite-type tricarboxylate transporter receptor subunit TctC
MQRRKMLGALAGALFVPYAGSSSAQGNPTRIIVGFAAGTGVVDAVGRLLAEKMKGDYAANLIVDNRVGVGGQLAVVAAKAGPADGSVMVLAPMSNFSVHPHIYPKIAYDPFKDFVPVGNVVISDLVLAVGPGVPDQVTSVPQFIEWCRANPAKASFGTGATGSKIHFAGMRLGIETGVKLTHIGYTAGGQAVTDLGGGSVPAYIGTVSSVLPQLSRMRVLATMGDRRSKFLPSVPTLVEQGYKNFIVVESVGLYLPAGATEQQVQRLHAATVKALSTPEAAALLTTAGVEGSLSTSGQMADQLRTESQQWGQLVKQIGFRQEA